MTIRFQFAADKAAAAIQQMTRDHPGIELHAALKACYFADRSHLNEHHRPVFGAQYRAMRYGPVPLEIYEMMKGEPYWLAELGIDEFPWTREGYSLKPAGGNAHSFSDDVFSETDIIHLTSGLQKSLSMTFSHRTAETHGSDWQNAQLGMMSYEDMIDESDLKPEIIQYLRETAMRLRL